MLTSKQRAYLRSLASNEPAIMQVGKSGIGENLIKTVSDVLEARELIKLSVLENSGEEAREVAEALAEATDWCGVRSGRHFDKFKECGLSVEKSAVVSAPSIAEAPVSIECRVKEIIPLGSHDMFIGEVVSVAVDEQYIDPETGKLDLGKAKLIAYAHGEYFTLGEKLGTFGWTVKGSSQRSEMRKGRKTRK